MFRKNLPHSDRARIEAMKMAVHKCEEIFPDIYADTPKVESFQDRRLAFQPENLVKLLHLYPRFRDELEKEQHIEEFPGIEEKLKKTRMLALHFFQVFSLAIERDVFLQDEKSYFDLDREENFPRALGDPLEVINWARRIVNGERKRVEAGLEPMSFPSSGEVEIALKELMEVIPGERIRSDTSPLRKEVDSLISEIWEEIEFRHRRLAPTVKEKMLSEYGIVSRN